METKYSKGPWKIDDSAIHNLKTKEISSDADDTWIAQVLNENKRNYNGAANAKLIRAAPELLEHLTALLIVAEASGISGESIEEAKQLINRINS